MNQKNEQKSDLFFENKHEQVGPDWNQIMIDSAINGVTAGISVNAADFLTWFTTFKPTWATAVDDAVLKPSDEMIGPFRNPHVIDPLKPNVGVSNVAEKISQVGAVAKAGSWLHEGSAFMNGLAKGVPGFNYMSVFHDSWAGFANMAKWTIGGIKVGDIAIKLSILPSIPFTYFALGGNIFAGVGTGVENGVNNQ